MINTSRRGFLSVALSTAIAPAAWAQPQRPYFDGLSFLPEDLADIQRARVSAMICDVSQVETVRDPDGTPRYKRTPARNLAELKAAVARLENSPHAYVARRGSDIGSRPGAAAFLQFQSAETVGSDLSRLQEYRNIGLSVLQFTHHNNTDWAGGCLELKPSGLTPLGREGLLEMNRLHMLVDVSHGSEASILEAAKLSRLPVVYSHGACRAIVDHPRCITDRAIQTIAERGGICGIFMMSFWLTRSPIPTPEHWVAHIRHVIKKGGLDAVAIANDFPMSGEADLVRLGNDNRKGVAGYLEWWRAMRKLGLPGFERDPEHVVIPEFNSINRVDVMERTLERARFTGREIDAIMWGNWQRVMTDVLG